jgi:hypothetical protein
MNNLYLIKSGDNGFVEETSAVISAEGGDISINSSLHVDSAGNIGIGSSNPTNKLDVVGSASISNDLTVDNIIFTNVGGQSPSAANDIIKYDGNNWVVAAASTLPGGGGGAGNSDVPAGLITNLPQGTASYEVNFGFDSNNDRIVYDNVPKIAASLEIDGPGEIIPHTISGVSESGYHVVFSEELPTANYRMHTVFGGTDAFWETGVANLEYSERNVEIDRSLYVGQKVGIGTTNPADELHINSAGSNVNLRLTRDTDTGGRISCSDGADTPAIIFETIDSGSLSEKMRIKSGGNVGIGTTNPAGLLHLESDGPALYITDTTNNTDAVISSNNGGDIILNADLNDESGVNDPSQIQFKIDGEHVMRIKSNGNVGIGTTNPGALLEAYQNNSDEYDDASYANPVLKITNANTTAAIPHSLIAFRLDKNGGDGYLGFITDGSSPNTQHFVLGGQGVGEYLRIKNDGNVGIGTTNPAADLEIFSTVKPIIRLTGTGNNAVNTNFGEIQFYNRDGSGDGPNVAASIHAQSHSSTGSGGSLVFSTEAAGAGTEGQSAEPRMTILSDGNVGIGTKSPSAKLHVEGVLRTSVTDEPNAYSQFTWGGGLSRDNGGNGNIITTQPALIMNRIDQDGDGERTVTIHSDNASYFNGGNVGIGTTNPSAKLDIYTTGASAWGLKVRTDNGDADSIKLVGGGGDSDVKFVVKGGGNVGIGTTNPDNKLSVNGNASAHAYEFYQNTASSASECIHRPTTGEFAIRANSQERLRIDSSGNVGIGTSNPVVKLHIKGSGQSILGYRETNIATQDLFTLNSDVGSVNSIKFRIEADGKAYTGASLLTSDDRLKHNEQEIFEAIETLSKITPKKYIKTSNLYEPNHDLQFDENGNPIDENGDLVPHHIEAGVIAQQVLNIPELKFLVREEKLDEDGNTVWPYSLDYNSLFTYAIAAIQEQQTIIEDLKSRIETLEQ